MPGNKQSKKNLNKYENLMKQKFDLQDRMANIFNERWKLNNENTKCSKQLALVEDQVRTIFNRFRVELKKDDKPTL